MQTLVHGHLPPQPKGTLLANVLKCRSRGGYSKVGKRAEAFGKFDNKVGKTAETFNNFASKVGEIPETFGNFSMKRGHSFVDFPRIRQIS